MNDIAIKAVGLGKRYRLGARTGRSNSLRDALDGALRRLGQRHGAPREFWALRDASFEIRRGENVGIIGLNGAGKSTLLKVLSQIVTPTEGHATVAGRLGALLEVGTGFHQELTGRENVFLYGSILGMTQAEVAEKFDAIVAFAEIESFIDTPVKRYSSGMYVRLAFAVAAHLDPDILLLDEVLAVGDFSFQNKCMEFARSLEGRGATTLFVSHNMFSIKSLCERVIYLRKGAVAFDGATDQGLKLYEDDQHLQAPAWFNQGGEAAIEFTNVELLSADGAPRGMYDFEERMKVRIAYHARRSIRRPNFMVCVTRADNVVCCNFSTMADDVDLPGVEGYGVLEMTTPPLRLTADNYWITILVRENRFDEILQAQVAGRFHVRHPIYERVGFGVFHDPADWRHHAVAAVNDERARA
ncbi:MAG TPA: ABC transporter ATP-binding protein [Phenylobacterium sp.]|uniref:ABC transporter ATP-binding protein n=1 Tax=Phenylobacterium sp. TaxID=1871053 RepID=UPI002B49CD78|nr:ABC transporter ATP-binding protein [Phenylobacterium sp.]HKR88777.1 ABC transporter ATP-binding protein [Phenylobacterium sp.]